MASILLCDDTDEVRRLLRVEFGFHPDLDVVAEAANGREAITRAAELQPDVVVLDIAMPEMDGIEALLHIKEVAPRTSVVMLSAFDTTQLRDLAHELGAAAYVNKGKTPTDIAEVVTACARGEGAPWPAEAS
ncbi:MAG: response regulator transcription factor [Actinomycetota bacterium]